MTSGPDPSDPVRADHLMDRVADAAQALHDAEDQHRVSAAQLAEALLAAHQGGFTWSEVARAADLGSAETARIRAYRAKDAEDLPPALRWRRERGSAARPETPTAGLSVTEAAKRLDVSRKTVYAWIRSGRLTSTTDEAGRTRVLEESLKNLPES